MARPSSVRFRPGEMTAITRQEPNPGIHLEAMEEAENKGSKPEEIRYARLAGLPKREHSERILGYCRKWYTTAYHNKRKTRTPRIL